MNTTGVRQSHVKGSFYSGSRTRHAAMERMGRRHSHMRLEGWERQRWVSLVRMMDELQQPLGGSTWFVLSERDEAALRRRVLRLEVV